MPRFFVEHAPMLAVAVFALAIMGLIYVSGLPA